MMVILWNDDECCAGFRKDIGKRNRLVLFLAEEKAG
jgi:hypothetical protein